MHFKKAYLMKKLILPLLFLTLPGIAFAGADRDQLGKDLIQLNQKIIDFDNKLGFDKQTRAEGVDFLYDSLSLATEIFIEKGSIGTPVFVDWITNSRKVAGDNPWTRYRSSMIKPKAEYLLEGQVGNALYLGVQVYSWKNGKNIALAEKNISIKKNDLNKEGAFSIPVGPNVGQNGIRTDAEDYILIVREYYENGLMRQNKPANYNITQKSGDQDTPFIADPLERISHASAFFNSLVESSLDLTAQMSQKKNDSVDLAPNPALVQALYPTTDNHYDGFYIQLKDDQQAIKLTGKMPSNLLYASVTFYNPYWVTSEYDKHKSYLTKQEIKTEADGSYVIYITKNWLENKLNLISTQGHQDGIVAIRYLGEGGIDFNVESINVKDIPNLPSTGGSFQKGGGSLSLELLLLPGLALLRKMG